MLLVTCSEDSPHPQAADGLQEEGGGQQPGAFRVGHEFVDVVGFDPAQDENCEHGADHHADCRQATAGGDGHHVAADFLAITGSFAHPFAEEREITTRTTVHDHRGREDPEHLGHDQRREDG